MEYLFSVNADGLGWLSRNGSARNGYTTKKACRNTATIYQDWSTLVTVVGCSWWMGLFCLVWFGLGLVSLFVVS